MLLRDALTEKVDQNKDFLLFSEHHWKESKCKYEKIYIYLQIRYGNL